MSVQLRLFEPIPADMLIGRTVQHHALVGVIDEVLEWQNIDNWMNADAKARHVKVKFPTTYMKGSKEVEGSYHMVLRLDRLIVLN